MALNSNTSPDANWTGLLRINPRTNDAGVPIAAGVVPPRLTTTERDALVVLESGTIVYNTTTNKLNFYNGTAWEAVTSA